MTPHPDTDICNNCSDIQAGSFYHGMTCPKCLRPFRVINPHPDTERFRYEIEAKTEFDKYREETRWPNGVRQANLCFNTFYSNSNGKEIASFNLKAWK